MKFKIPLIILILLVGLQLMAQKRVTVSGSITGDKNEPLAGVLITTENQTGTSSDIDGSFSLSLPGGKHQLTFSYLGYDKLVIPIDTRLPELGKIVMQLNSTTLEEIIVSAAPHNFKSQFKGSNYRIAPTTIRNVNPLSTEELLRTVPGINIIGDMGISNRPNISIRGSWGRRSKKVLLMEDGSPAAPAPYVAPGAYYNPVSDRITSIEIYKGADMLRFGPNNMFGAVNYITALPPQQPELRLKLATGQRNYTTGLFSYGGTWENLGALVEGVYKKFDGFTDNSSVDILNLNAKIFTQLSENQSLYFKVSGQYEDNQASLSSQTPFTFEHDPTQNPLDADQFTMRRYGLDIIHKWLPGPNVSFTSKIYASDFERDWWRQITTKIPASQAGAYLGNAIFNERYSYLQDLDPGPEDYIIAGRIMNGKESTSDSRWAFTVSGIRETFNANWNAWGREHQLEIGFKLHQETYKDRFLLAENSRWARSGQPTTDLRYYLWSGAGFVRNEFNLGKMTVTPIFRFEHIDMYRQNVLALARDSTLTGTEKGREYNVYNVALPGVTVDYNLINGTIFGSVYRGFIAPSKIFGFLVEQDGRITNPLAGQSINMQPELSINTELGWRGSLFSGLMNGQLTYFNNTIDNFYAGGRNEIFQELGRINVQGLEMALGVDLIKRRNHHLQLYTNATLLQSKVISGKLRDKDLFSQVIHNQATKAEYVNKVNSNRDAFEVFITNNAGEEVLLNDATLEEADFEDITTSVVRFGNGGLKDADLPYSPGINANAGFNYRSKSWSLGISGQYVGKQFTEFHNFIHESADGAIGQLPAYFTMDAFLNYDFTLGKRTFCNVFVNGKNITNEIYRASRLNRATSGIFPGGFRQIILGMNIRL